jgi:hypothetical protein
MENKKPILNEFSQKLKMGLDLYFKRLVEKTKKENGSLFFSIDGKIVEVQAKDL